MSYVLRDYVQRACLLQRCFDEKYVPFGEPPHEVEVLLAALDCALLHASRGQPEAQLAVLVRDRFAVIVSPMATGGTQLIRNWLQGQKVKPTGTQSTPSTPNESEASRRKGDA